jgi:uncharacterized repeat protein (TIGR03803 family)
MSLDRSRVSFPVSIVALLLALIGSCESQVFTDLVNFGKTTSNPWFATPTQGRDGRLYWTNSNNETDGTGTIMVFDVNTGFRSVIYHFESATGTTPYGGLTLGVDGSFYGTAQYGGASNYGVLFKITPSGTYTVLHNFAGGTDGIYPSSPPVLASDGNYYGTTGLIDAEGETQSTMYRYSPSSGFTSFGDIGGTQGPIIQASDGNLYATTYGGGVLEFSTSGELLNGFALPSADGTFTLGPVMQASDGNFYGAAQDGGPSNYGTIYKMDPGGVFSLLYGMTAISPDPDGGLIEASDGNLYGDAWYGTLYQITTGGDFTVLYQTTVQQGDGVGAALIQHTNGTFYGTAHTGGPKGLYGTLFSLEMGLPPFISMVKPQGRAGSLAQVLGQGFTGTTSVTFNGVTAPSFHVVSDTYMTAVVPKGATTGPVAVTTPAGTLTSIRNFQIIH